MGQLPEIKRFD